MRGRILVGMLLVAVVAQASGARAADTAPTLDLRAAIYEDQSKSAVGAVVLEIFLPGMGSVYANDMRGALITWGLCAGGLAAALIGLSQIHIYGPDGPPPPPMPEKTSPLAFPLLLGGMAAGIYGRIYGLQNAADASGRHNAALRSSLGLVPVVTSDTTGLTLGGRF